MAADLHAALTSRNYPSFIEKVLLDNDKTWYRVKVGYYPEWAIVQKTRRQLIRDFNLHPVILPRQ